MSDAAEDPLDDTDQSKGRSKRKTKAEQEQARRDVALRQIMATREGRAWMYWILNFAGVFRLSFAGEATHATAFNEGQRNVGQILFADVNRVTPAQYLTMMTEAQEA